MKKRICIISDAIEEPFDEGVKVFVYNLIKEFSKSNTLLCIGKTKVINENISPYCKELIPTNKLYLGVSILEAIRDFHPDIIYYIPVACATIFSFIRSKVIQIYGKYAQTVMITLQPRSYSKFKKLLIPLLKPDLILSQSEKTKNELNLIGCNVKRIFAGVDTEKFVPIKIDKRNEIRRKYRLPIDIPIILHVGHINKNRNIQIMKKIQRQLNVQTVVVGSTSTPLDKDLYDDLRNSGVIIINEAIENIEEIYQCVNCYLFPVFSESACIEIPLSIFEALSCNISVVSTRFGGITEFVEEKIGIKYCDSDNEIIENVKSVIDCKNNSNRKIAEKYSWNNIAKQIFELSKLN